MLIDPAGRAMPCHAAGVIPGMTFDSVRDHALQWLWEKSSAFQRFRGEDWMPEPCRSCERRAEDFGGCRCQAMLLTHDATATDPACVKAPAHRLIEGVLQAVNENDEDTTECVAPPASANMYRADFWVYRPNPEQS